MLLTPLWLSLKVASVATLLCLLLGVPLAWLLAKGKFPGRTLLEIAVLLPLTLPPTVLGYYLLLLIGAYGPLGRLLSSLGIELVFTWKAAVLAAFVASLPLLVKASQASFEAVDSRLEDAARTLGRSELSVFFTITLPLGWRGILAGTVLAFSRAMGEFGITLMVAGSIPGRTRTIPLAIYEAVQALDLRTANLLAALATGTVVVILLLVGRLTRIRF